MWTNDIKNQQVQDPNQEDPSSGVDSMDYDPSLEGDYGTDYGTGTGSGFGDYSLGDGYVDGGGMPPTGDGNGQGSSVGDLRSQVTDLLAQLKQNTALSDADKSDIANAINKIGSEINVLTSLNPQQQDAKIQEIQANLVYFQSNLGDSGSNWGADTGNAQDPSGLGSDTGSASGGGSNSGIVTRHAIQETLTQLKNGDRPLVDGATLSKDQCISKLQEALSDLNNGDFQKASDAYGQALSSLGDQMSPTDMAGALFGGTPTKVDGNNIQYECKDGETSLSLQGRSGATTSKKITVDNATDVQFTPAKPDDSVQVTHEGSYYVIQDGSDTFKINDSAKIHIASDHVTGDADNPDGNLSVGAGDSNRVYVSTEELGRLADKISNASGAVKLDSDKKTSEAQKILGEVADAMRESDPKKRADDWSKIGDDLSQLYNGDMGPGDINDVAQTIFNAVYDGLGEQGFKDAFGKQGLIPPDFANSLSIAITLNTGENTNSDSKDHAFGGPGWTHQATADWLKKYSTASA